MQFTEFPTKAFPDLDDKPKIGTGHLYISCEKQWFFIFFPFFFLYPQSPESCTQLHLSSHPVCWCFLPVVRRGESHWQHSPSLRPHLYGHAPHRHDRKPWTPLENMLEHVAQDAGKSLVGHGWSSFFTTIFFPIKNDHLLEIFSPNLEIATMFGVFARKVSVAVAFWWDSIVIADVSRLISLSQ